MERVLKVRSFANKIILLFILIFFISSIFALFLVSYYVYDSELGKAKKGIELAIKIRKESSQQILDMYSKSLPNMINESMDNDYLLYITDKIPDFLKNNYKYYLKDKVIYFKFKKDGKKYAAAVDEKLLNSQIMSKYGIVSIYNPNFFLATDTNLNLNNICAYSKYENSNFYLAGCIKKETILKMAFTEGFKIVIISGGSFLFFVLLFYFIARRLILFPLNYIKYKLNELEKKDIRYVKFYLHKFGSDELAKISEKFEEFRIRLIKSQDKIYLVFHTVTKILSATNEFNKFSKFVLNNLDKILNLKGSYLIYQYNSEEVKSFSDKYLQDQKNSLELGNFNEIILKRDIDSDSYIEFHGFRKDKLNEEDLEYLEIILSNLIYVIKLYRTANYDFLTRVFNRRKMMELIQKNIENSKKFAILMLDMDDFKRINDTFGHDLGDEILKEIVKILKNIRRQQDIIGRYGGEEFIILSPDADGKEALNIAEDIRKAISEKPVVVRDNKIYISVSIGIAEFPIHGNSPSELLKAADIALYKAKKEGKNKAVYLIPEEVKKIISLEFEFKDAILDAIKNDRFVPFFQPIVEAKTGNIYGYEVLARIYDEKENKYIPAYQFINNAIKYGLVEEIDKIIQEKAIKYFSEKKLNKCLFLNMSKNFIYKSGNLENLYNLCVSNGLKPENVYLEITEEEAILDFKNVKELIQYGKSLGFRYAIDDFGAGYSNFVYLKHFNVDIIKIDGSLVANIHQDLDNQIIVENIIRIAKHKNIKVLAEMVELEEEKDILIKLGVDYLQGYLFGKPEKEVKE
ncbi:diguanylate cyclase/phosphodiesterase [Sulfurihydrogenibium sp. YO3AOP1]|uniref:putative bifunctional diguanylate cyclase/phosphodiesterase n=1 Tax=Sulfurihydrogenibium sp. (strain YO3AOP1) TaxID=436114 RepID=UPI0001750C82|nr:GGDEF and EAL domain-containing protein [Sulfurihydrogenibium sp. YO3AOP1]ACD67158.1 diguanylate cyclase/phosphodiesterase [Sulfurihydrogenibium sp. YO3AOP1]